MASIELSPEEIAILRSALDSAEYWEHKDALPHNSGYILDPEDYEIEGLKESEAWAEVLAIRALDTRLMELEKCTESQVIAHVEYDGQTMTITESEQRVLDGNR